MTKAKGMEATRKNEQGVLRRKTWKGLFQAVNLGARGMELNYVPPEVLRMIPLWVEFPNLSLHYWGLAALSKIGSALGKPMYADECTSRLGRISYAKVLIEMDVTKPLPRHVEFFYPNGGRMQQKVQYDWKPIYCYTCCIVGHSCTEPNKKEQRNKEGYKQQIRNKVKQQWKPMETTGG
ncbi:hypothetical protein KY284_007751 [Solanum tuberosum]|nr:hypothetical protein KY284_007751 [Solanum tuberosum]